MNENHIDIKILQNKVKELEKDITGLIKLVAQQELKLCEQAAVIRRAHK